MQKFKPGDLVECIDNTDVQDDLSIGQTYIVENVGSTVLSLVGNAFSFSPSRFRLVKSNETPVACLPVPSVDSIFNDNEHIYGFDVDNTLISGRRRSPESPFDIEIVNPYTGMKVYAKPHVGHIDLLKEMHGRGRYIRVHSAAGGKWANAVVNALGIRPWCHSIETKMVGYIDDQPVQEWLRNHIYLKPEDRT